MNERDIWKAADEMVFVYGEDADLHSAMRADDALDKGDVAGEHLWNRITQAILQLRRQNPSIGEPLN